MFSNLLTANLLVVLVRYLGFIFYLGSKNRRQDYYYLTFMYGIYAISFFLARGYVGVLFYLMCASNIVMQLLRVHKNILVKLFFTISMMFLYVYECDYTFINNIPYLVALSYLWIKPYFKGFKKELVEHIENILIIIYAYNYKLYVLAIYEIYRISFKIITKYLKKYVTFINKRIE